MLAHYHEDVEFDLSRSPFRGLLPKHVVHGHDGLRAFFRERYEAWQSVHDECVSLTSAGDRVISEVVSGGRGRASGLEADLTHYAVWTVRCGKVARTAWVTTREEALEAARV